MLLKCAAQGACLSAVPPLPHANAGQLPKTQGPAIPELLALSGMTRLGSGGDVLLSRTCVQTLRVILRLVHAAATAGYCMHTQHRGIPLLAGCRLHGTTGALHLL